MTWMVKKYSCPHNMVRAGDYCNVYVKIVYPLILGLEEMSWPHNIIVNHGTTAAAAEAVWRWLDNEPTLATQTIHTKLRRQQVFAKVAHLPDVERSITVKRTMIVRTQMMRTNTTMLIIMMRIMRMRMIERTFLLTRMSMIKSIINHCHSRCVEIIFITMSMMAVVKYQIVHLP